VERNGRSAHPAGKARQNICDRPKPKGVGEHGHSNLSSRASCWERQSKITEPDRIVVNLM